jgi:hypothetical protein
MHPTLEPSAALEQLWTLAGGGAGAVETPGFGAMPVEPPGTHEPAWSGSVEPAERDRRAAPPASPPTERFALTAPFRLDYEVCRGSGRASPPGTERKWW